MLSDPGYVANTDEDCVFIKKSGKEVAVIALYVDYFFIFCKNKEMKNKLYQVLSEHFEVKDLGEAKSYLGMCITRNRKEGNLKLDQKCYTADVLK